MRNGVIMLERPASARPCTDIQSTAAKLSLALDGGAVVLSALFVAK